MHRKRKMFRRRELNFVIRDLILAMALCHNVTPVFAKHKEFQASSPDEIALLQMVESLGVHLLRREEEFM